MTTSHSPTISITVTLDANPGTPLGFGTPTYLVDKATNSLDGDTFIEYSGASALADATADQVAGFISAATLAAATTAFAQPRKVTAFRVANVDIAAAQTYSQALAALTALGLPIWLVLMDSRTAALQVALSATIEGLPYFLILQSSDADWLTTGIPAAYSTIEDNERTAVIFHDNAAIWADVGWGCNRAAFNPDLPSQGSVQWEAPLSGVTAYTTALTATQTVFAKGNNCAVLGTMGPSTSFVDPGVNLAGRGIYEVLTADWFGVRLREAMEALVVQQAGRGRKIILSPTGQAMVLAVAQQVVDVATSARHLVEGQVLLDTPPLTAADLDARRITLTGEGQIAGSARLFVFDLYFTRDQVVVPT